MKTANKNLMLKRYSFDLPEWFWGFEDEEGTRWYELPIETVGDNLDDVCTYQGRTFVSLGDDSQVFRYDEDAPPGS